jgi:hypothetical protein
MRDPDTAPLADSVDVRAAKNVAARATFRIARWERFAPAAIQGATAILFLVGWFAFPAPFAVHLARLMELEFLALHAGGFLGLPLLWSPTRPLPRVLRVLAIGFFGVIYGMGGYGVLGWPGVVELAAMILATYAGVLFARGATRSERAWATAARWFGCLMLFMLTASLLGMPSGVNEWHETRTTLLFGAAYFLVLATLEASGIYPALRRIFSVSHPRNAHTRRDGIRTSQRED